MIVGRGEGDEDDRLAIDDESKSIRKNGNGHQDLFSEKK